MNHTEEVPRVRQRGHLRVLRYSHHLYIYDTRSSRPVTVHLFRLLSDWGLGLRLDHTHLESYESEIHLVDYTVRLGPLSVVWTDVVGR